MPPSESVLIISLLSKVKKNKKPTCFLLICLGRLQILHLLSNSSKLKIQDMPDYSKHIHMTFKGLSPKTDVKK